MLAKQLETTFGASDQLIESTERLIATQQLLTGESDTNLRAALGNLTRATGDYDKATGLLITSQNIAAATGKDLETVSISLGKASMGNFTALKKLGIPLDENVVKSKDFSKVLDVLNTTFAGASATAADTFGGRLKIVKTQFGEIVETIGMALLPYLDQFAKFLTEKVAPAVSRITTVITENGLIAGFQQLIFESGGAGTAVVGVFRVIAIAAGEAANVLYKVFYLAKAAIEATNPFKIVQATQDAIKGLTGTAVNIDDLKSAFDNVAVPVNRFKTELMSADQAERFFNKTGKITADTFGDGAGGGGGVSKAVKTATEKLKLYTDALKSSNSAQKSFTAAQKASVKAGQSLTEANTNLLDAQSALDQAVAGYGADSPQAKKAAKELEQAQRGLERAGYNVEGSLFAIKDAEEALKKARSDPESNPQSIREAESALAEAKLSSADAIDQQTEATDGLTKATGLLNEAVFGASIGSDIYTQLSDALTDAKNKQADATEAVAEAIDRETEALKNYRDAIESAGKIAALYPKVVAANPMAGVAGSIPATVTGNSTGFNASAGGGFSPVINVNAGLITDKDTLALDISDLLTEFARKNGGNALRGISF